MANYETKAIMAQQGLRIYSWLELRGNRDGKLYVPQLSEEQVVRICLYVHVCVHCEKGWYFNYQVWLPQLLHILHV